MLQCPGSTRARRRQAQQGLPSVGAQGSPPHAATPAAWRAVCSCGCDYMCHIQGCPEARGAPALAPPARARPPQPPAAAARPAERARLRGAQRSRRQPPLLPLPPPAVPRAPCPCSAGRLCRARSRVRRLHMHQQVRLSEPQTAVQSEPGSLLCDATVSLLEGLPGVEAVLPDLPLSKSLSCSPSWLFCHQT